MFKNFLSKSKFLCKNECKFFSNGAENHGRKQKVLDETTLKNYNSIFKLKDRGILSVTGEDATSFLQGLITNDMNIFETNPKQAAIFTLFLSPKGRILYDGIIVKSHL